MNNILQEMTSKSLSEAMLDFSEKVPVQCRSGYFEAMVDKWGYDEVIGGLAEKYWFNVDEITRVMKDVDRYNKPLDSHKTPKTIVTYYRNITNGGAQRVVTMLCNIWSSMTDEQGNKKYNVILVTDNGPEEDEYELNADVKREYIPSYKVEKREYLKRMKAINDLLDRNDVDVFISNMFTQHCTWWDMLTVKSHPSRPAFVLHVHSFTCLPYGLQGCEADSLQYIYSLCDGIVTLSVTDEMYTQIYNKKAKCIGNPSTFNVDEIKISDYVPHRIVWVARIDGGKRPLDLIPVMKLVTREISDAKLVIVGKGDEKLEAELRKLIKENHLEKNIECAGFTMDVGRYYSEASLFVSTSHSEGYAMTFYEAQAYGLPIVCYEMPWLEVEESGAGVVSVPQENVVLMAQAIIDILKDSHKVKKLGAAGRKHVEEVSSIDIGKTWEGLFNGVYGDDSYFERDLTVDELKYKMKILITNLTGYQQQAKYDIKNHRSRELEMAFSDEKDIYDKLQQAYAEKSEINAKLKQTYEEKSEINAKLQQTYAEKLELNEKLQQTYAEKSELNEKLQRTYAEKSEINARLKQAYEDKTERGERIKELEAELAAIRGSVGYKLMKGVRLVPGNEKKHDK